MSRARAAAALPARVVGAALVVRLFDEWWSYLPAGVVDDLHRELGIGYTGAGWLLGLLTIGGLLGSPLAMLADHVDRRACAVAGALLIGACLGAYALGAPFPVLAVATAVMGAASDLLIDAVEAGLGDAAGDDLDRLLGWQHALASVGDLLGPALLALGASTAIGWRGAFGITAAAMVGFAGYLATVAFPPPGEAAPRLGAMLADAWAIARRRDVRRLAVLELLITPLDEPLLAFVVARAAAGSRSEAIAQVLAVAVMAGGVGGSLLVGRVGLSGRVRRVGPLVLVAGTAVSVGLGSVAAGALGMTAVGLGMAVVWADVHVRALTVVPGRAATVSTVIGAIGTAAAFVPVLAGALADRAGLASGLAVYVAVAAAIAAVARAGETGRRAP